MWCYLSQIECCQADCDGCFYDNFPINLSFNYECPDCHGKFSYASYKYIDNKYIFGCPFCGRTMEGL